MRALIVATNETPRSLRRDIAEGIHQRVDYFELAERLNSDYVDYNVVQWGHPIRRVEEKFKMDFRLAGAVLRRVRRDKPDVVFSLSERVGLPLAMLLPRNSCHLVMMHHPMSAQKISLMKRGRFGRRWDRIFTLSQAEADGLRDALQVPADSVAVLPSPVDTDFYAPLEEEVPIDAQDHIQALGLSHRDYPTLLRAIRTLPDIPCHIRAGSTWVTGRAGHEDQAIPDNVTLQPFVHPSLLRETYAYSRFIVVPVLGSTQWSAGCTAVLQAQSMGKAVVATDTPGLRDYVSNGETGILVPPGDAEAMARAIDELWRNPDRTAEMGRRARERLVNSDFEFGKWLDKTTRLVESIAAGTE